jgi:predicted DNA-binding protein
MPSTSIYVREVFYKRLQAIAEDLGLTVTGVISEAVEYALSDEKDFVKAIEEELPEEYEASESESEGSEEEGESEEEEEEED